MAKEPFLPLFFGDFLASTAEWEGEERALYLLLLGYQWSLGSLPTEPRRLCKLAAWDWALFERCWLTVGAKFREKDGRLTNERLEKHRVRGREISEKRANAGAIGGSVTQANAKQMLDASKAIASTLLSHPSHPIPFHSDPEPVRAKKAPSEPVVALDRDGRALEVFAHWQREWRHPTTKLDQKRRKRIEARLRDFTVDQLCNAISGFRHSPWHTGTDPKGNGTVYDSIDTLLRDSAQVETGLRLFAHPPRPPPKAETAHDRMQRLLNGNDDSRVIEHDPEFPAIAGH
jgi:uncharacterized protein YdaU (DUF1376 family)